MNTIKNVNEMSVFLPYFGCNHKIIETKFHLSGGFTFKKHLHKPLTYSLYEDLVERTGITNLWIIKYNESEWTLGRGPGSATIYLDKNDLVEDIYLVPHFGWF